MKKDVVFNLQIPQLDAIEKLETLITSAPILKISNPNLPARLKIDTSSEGLRALLEQNHSLLENPQWHPQGYSSHALRDYEKQYAQIEKETLSIVFGVEHFHEYLYGRKFTIINDHQPLKLIFTCPQSNHNPITIHPQSKNSFDCRSMISSSSLHSVKQC